MGNFKWGFYSMKLLTRKRNLEVNHLFFVGILKCHRGYLVEGPLLYFIWPIFIHSSPPPNLYFCSWHDSRSCLQLLFGEGLKSGFTGYCIPWETYDSYFVPGLLSYLLFHLEASPAPRFRWSLDSMLNFYLLLSVSPSFVCLFVCFSILNRGCLMPPSGFVVKLNEIICVRRSQCLWGVEAGVASGVSCVISKKLVFVVSLCPRFVWVNMEKVIWAWGRGYINSGCQNRNLWTEWL